MLCEGDQGQGKGKVWNYIEIGDTEKLLEEYKLSGAIIRQEPTSFSRAFEMQIEDIIGNVIRFGSDSKKNVPYSPWPYMNRKMLK
ncbi:MAG: hypothetical protein M9903_02875 [Saprospiraceae bacterium]|nr:hypothetical protein [Saprospiraceae bacterium]MCO5282426.1 hypothetical protein [Saprospiraceae bacterium]HNL05642.1 hypothetical protein [Bacteroidia bacterium]